MLIRALIVWLLMLVLAVANGLVRDHLMTPLIGADLSLPLSGISLSLFILLLSYLTIAWMAPKTPAASVGIGTLWVLLTLAFEYALGRMVLGKTWQEINAIFNLTDGNLFSVVLLAALFAPWISARQKGLI